MERPPADDFPDLRVEEISRAVISRGKTPNPDLCDISLFFRIIAKIPGEINGKVLRGKIFFKAGAGQDHEMTEREKGARVLPGADLQEGVQPENEIQFRRLSPEPPKIGDGLDGVGFSRAGDFRVGEGKTGVVGDGQPHHLRAQGGGEKILLLLVGRVGGRDENDRVEVQKVADLLGRAQMAVMDRIESSPEKADFFHRRICPEPETMNFKVVRSSTPMGPNECSLVVLIPISAPRPSSKPSLNRVEAFTSTVEEGTSRKKPLRIFVVPGDDGFGVGGPVADDVVDRLVQVRRRF